MLKIIALAENGYQNKGKIKYNFQKLNTFNFIIESRGG